MQNSTLNKNLIAHLQLDENGNARDSVSKILGTQTDTYPVRGRQSSGRRWYSYNGTSDHTDLPAIVAFGSTDFSVIRRVTVGALGAARTLIGGAADAFSLHISATGYLTAVKYGGSALTASTTLLVAGTVYSVGYTRTGTTGTYYVNGVAAGTCTDANDYTVACTLLGNGTGFFNGNDFMCRVFNYCLSLAQVVNYGKPEYPIEWVDKGATKYAVTWTNGSPGYLAFETLTTTNEVITSAINSSGYGVCQYSYPTAVGKKYLSMCSVTLNSGTAPGFRANTDNVALDGATMAINSAASGAVSLSWTSTINGTSWIGYRVNNEVPTNFAVPTFSFIQLGCILDLNAEGMGKDHHGAWLANHWSDLTNQLEAEVTGAILNIPAASNLGGMMFNGTTSKIAYTGMNGLTGDISIAGRFYLQNIASGRIIDTSLLFVVISTTIGFTRNGGGNQAVSNSIATKTWYNYVITSTSIGVTNFYINAVANGTANQAAGTPTAGTDWVIGNRAAGDRQFDGIIEPIRIYSRILDLDEISLLNSIGK